VLVIVAVRRGVQDTAIEPGSVPVPYCIADPISKASY